MLSLKAELKSLHVRQAPSPSFSKPSLIIRTQGDCTRANGLHRAAPDSPPKNLVNIMISSYKGITLYITTRVKTQCILQHQMPMIWANGTFTNTSIFNKFMELNTSDKRDWCIQMMSFKCVNTSESIRRTPSEWQTEEHIGHRTH